MNYVEEALSFNVGQSLLQGIITMPMSGETPKGTGLLIIVGGPQYRVGSHRQFVLLARHLAARGHPTMRFDYTGMGDSAGNLHSFLNVENDISAAIDAFFRKAPNLKNIVLCGLCDGASAALLFLPTAQPERIAGLCLLNPWVRSEASLARTHVKHYYIDRMKSPEFWIKLMSGKVAGTAVRGLIQNIRLAKTSSSTAANIKLNFQERMALALVNFKKPVLLILSGADYTAQEFIEYSSSDAGWKGALQKQNISRLDIPEADHTFSDAGHRATVENVTAEWLKKFPECN